MYICPICEVGNSMKMALPTLTFNELKLLESIESTQQGELDSIFFKIANFIEDSKISTNKPLVKILYRFTSLLSYSNKKLNNELSKIEILYLVESMFRGRFYHIPPSIRRLFKPDNSNPLWGQLCKDDYEKLLLSKDLSLLVAFRKNIDFEQWFSYKINTDDLKIFTETDINIFSNFYFMDKSWFSFNKDSYNDLIDFIAPNYKLSSKEIYNIKKLINCWYLSIDELIYTAKIL